MARFGNYDPESSTLDVRSIDGGSQFQVYLIPDEKPKVGTAAAKRLKDGVKLIEFQLGSPTLRIFPVNTRVESPDYLGPKYDKVRMLVLDMEPIDEYSDQWDLSAFLEELPSGFVKDASYGLGLLKGCNRLIRLIEENTECEEIEFSNDYESTVIGDRFVLSKSTFDHIWAEMNRINSRGNSAAARVKDVFVHNLLAKALNLPLTEVSLGRHPTSRVITKAADGVEELTEKERKALLRALSSESTALAKQEPTTFRKLQRDIELAGLDLLISNYRESLDRNVSEAHWQDFFDENAFALQQVFGAPMVNVHSGASVGGAGISGAGGKIADYLVKNSLTNNLALVEIKKPTTALLSNKEYRGGVFGPSTELAGAISQVLDQAYQLNKSLPALKDSSRQWDLESYSISCFVVIGRTPSAEEPEKQKSFELYRGNSRNVSIITYDEILARLIMLRDFLVVPIEVDSEVSEASKESGYAK